MTIEQLIKIFTYHVPVNTQIARYTEIRDATRSFALLLNDLCSESREKSLSLTRLQECVQMANASIAINESLKEPS